MSFRSGVPGACRLAWMLAVLLLLPAAAAAQEKENPILTFVKSKVKDPDKPFTLVSFDADFGRFTGLRRLVPPA